MFGFIGNILEKQGKREFKSIYSPIVNKRAQNIVIAGKTGEKIYNDFEKAADFNNGNGIDPNIYAHERYRENIENSMKIEEDGVEFFDTDYSSSVLIDILEQSEENDRSLFFSDKEYKEDLNRWIDKQENNITVIYK